MCLTRRITSSERGFTLVEVVASGVILAVVIGGLFAFVSQSSTIVRNGILRQRAFQEVHRVLASPQFSHDNFAALHGTPSADLALALPLAQIDTLDERSLSTIADNIIGMIVVSTDSVRCKNGTLEPGIAGVRIRARARWTDYSGSQDSVWLEKIITDNRG